MGSYLVFVIFLFVDSLQNTHCCTVCLYIELTKLHDGTHLFIFSPLLGPCGILTPEQVLNLCSLWWKHGVLTTGPPGKSLLLAFRSTMNLRSEVHVLWVTRSIVSDSCIVFHSRHFPHFSHPFHRNGLYVIPTLLPQTVL